MSLPDLFRTEPTAVWGAIGALVTVESGGPTVRSVKDASWLPKGVVATTRRKEIAAE